MEKDLLDVMKENEVQSTIVTILNTKGLKELKTFARVRPAEPEFHAYASTLVPAGDWSLAPNLGF